MVAIVIIGIVIVFAFALLLVSYTFYASQNKNAASLRCSEAANTFSMALDDELEDPEAYKNSDLWKYLRCNILQDEKTWPYYESGVSGHGRDEAYRVFDLRKNSNYPEVDGFPGSMKLYIYWTVKDDEEVKTALQTTTFPELDIDKKSGAEIHIEIVAESGSQSYSVENVYKVTISQISTSDEISKTLKKTAETKYAGTGELIYNPMNLSTENDKEIILTEKWEFESIGKK